MRLASSLMGGLDAFSIGSELCILYYGFNLIFTDIVIICNFDPSQDVIATGMQCSGGISVFIAV